ncbi:MAG: Ribonucleoside-diphosphate reductase, adenosylcobalamin-dependent [Parcubacteria group bacterium GW2011_GWB1_56_8]|nr:MAG: Ribonucleoside-diphosphate reductase, adenosylcobalamin-dependent [Parcubacteria group bacterium GW2011_GWB1_56_8]
MSLSSKTARDVIDALSQHFAIQHGFDESLFTQARTAPLSLRRAEAMYVLRQFGLSYSEIGLLFDMDHTSVLAACRRVVARFETHVGYHDEINALVRLAKAVVAIAKEKSMRRRPEDERRGLTHHFEIYAPSSRNGEVGEVQKIDGYIQTGEYDDGTLAEIFIKVGKQGDFHAVLDQFAIAASVALQHGAPADSFFRKFVGTQFEPAGATSNTEIPRCTSVLDYCARYVLSRYARPVTESDAVSGETK